MWIFLAIQVLFIIMLISGIAHSASTVHGCHADQYLSAADCRNATEAGSTIGVFIVVFFWAAVGVILGISRWVYKSTRKA